MMRVTPYLHLDGNCREVMRFYQECFGGQLELQVLGESPMAEHMPTELHDRILNAQLVAGEFMLMASDFSSPEQLVRSGVVALSVHATDLEATRAAFEKLSEGATVTNPLKEEFFGIYGDLTDKYGFSWMFEVAPTQE
jgi:PhnB protein